MWAPVSYLGPESGKVGSVGLDDVPAGCERLLACATWDTGLCVGQLLILVVVIVWASQLIICLESADADPGWTGSGPEPLKTEEDDFSVSMKRGRRPP